MDDRARFPAEQCILDYLAIVDSAERGAGTAAFLLRYGRFWMPPSGRQRDKLGMAKACFANAQGKLVTTPEDLVYVEGLAIPGISGMTLPVHHAWLADRKGCVVDPTWEMARVSCYFGVAFNSDYVAERAKQESGMPLVDNVGHGRIVVKADHGFLEAVVLEKRFSPC